MTQVEQIQAEIEALPREDFIRLREWFAEKTGGSGISSLKLIWLMVRQPY